MAIERRTCEFYLLKYVPDPVRNEFVHVGVVLKEAGKGTSGLKLRFTSDWRRVRCLDPEADTGMLEGLESELRRRFEAEPGGNLWHVLEDSFSNCVQMTAAKGYLAESLEAGVEELMRLYVEPQKREKSAARSGGRGAILTQMRSEFEQAGVWDLLRKRIRAAEYTRVGDPLRIDCGYRNGVVKMFQAVSLEPGQGVDAAKGLAFSAAGLRAGVERMERVPLELTAIVEPVRRFDEGGAASEAVESYRFAVETMEEQRIRVLTTADLGRVAAAARRELGV